MKNIKHVLRERWYAYEDATRMYESGYRPQNFYGLDEAEQVETEQTATEQVEAEQMDNERTDAEQTETKQTETGDEQATEKPRKKWFWF